MTKRYYFEKHIKKNLEEFEKKGSQKFELFISIT